MEPYDPTDETNWGVEIGAYLALLYRLNGQVENAASTLRPFIHHCISIALVLGIDGKIHVPYGLSERVCLHSTTSRTLAACSTMCMTLAVGLAAAARTSFLVEKPQPFVSTALNTSAGTVCGI
jgi:hypothetical protein